MAFIFDLNIVVLVLVLVHLQASGIDALNVVPVVENEDNIGIGPFWNFLTHGIRVKGSGDAAEDGATSGNHISQHEGGGGTPHQERSGDNGDTVSEQTRLGISNVHPSGGNLSSAPALSPRMRCREVRRERFRCCRVYDNVVEAWWCPHRRPFCCHQGTSCAICCTIDELRHLDAARDAQPDADTRRDQCPPLSGPRRPRLGTSAGDDESWFWNGMKAAWLTMVCVLLASVCCTCVAHKCIMYLVKVVNEEDPEADDEYLGYQLDRLALVEDAAPADRQRSRRPLPPKYSDINFIPVTPEAADNGEHVPNEPPPVYTSDVEPDTNNNNRANNIETNAVSPSILPSNSVSPAADTEAPSPSRQQ